MIYQHSYLNPLTNYNHFKHSYDYIDNINHREFWKLKCAYHQKQNITNFCKDINCLLPLCPKCIKIHTQQHSRKGVFAQFETINDCLQQAQLQYIKKLTYIDSLGKFGKQLQKLKRDAIFMSKENFYNAKKKAFKELEIFFNQYESIIDEEIFKDEKIFFQQLMNYQDSLSFMLEGCKNGIQKMKNPDFCLQGLINFYDQRQQRKKLADYYQSKLKKISMNLISIGSVDSQLASLSSFVKRYLNFGQKNKEFQQKIDKIHQENICNKPTFVDLRNKEIILYSIPNQIYSFNNNSVNYNRCILNSKSSSLYSSNFFEHKNFGFSFKKCLNDSQQKFQSQQNKFKI